MPPGQNLVAAALNPALGAVIRTNAFFVIVSVQPKLSVTVNLTLNRPVSVYWWLNGGLAKVCELASPKSHFHWVRLPFGVERSLKVMDEFLHPPVLAEAKSARGPVTVI